MIDTEKLRKAIEHFKFCSRPSSANNSTPATVGDINRLVKNTADLMSVFLAELEKD